MKPIFYEIKRSLTSKFVIILIIAIVALSSLLAYETSVTYNAPSGSSNPQVVNGYYLNGTELTIISYSYDIHGAPYSNVHLNFQYNNQTYSAATNGKGFSSVSINVELEPAIQLKFNYSYTSFRATQYSPLNSIVILPSSKYSGFEVLPGITSPKNNTNLGFLVFYVGANGSYAPPVNIYLVNASSQTFSSIQNKSLAASASDFVTEPVFPSNPSVHESYAVEIENSNFTAAQIYNSGGKFSTVAIIGPISDYVPVTESMLQSLFFSGTASIIGLFVPLLAIFAGYLTYGKDRSSGVLESVLKRPVTRGQLISTRFLSNAASILFAVFLSMIFVDLIFHYYLTIYFSTTFLLDIIWTYMMEGVTFLAIVYLISHLVKSQGALLGASIGLFVVLDLFWQIIPAAILAAFGISSGTSEYVSTTIILDYISPAGYSSLIQALLTNHLGTFVTQTINAGAFGISSVSLLIAGLLWMVVPFVAAYLLAVRRD